MKLRSVLLAGRETEELGDLFEDPSLWIAIPREDYDKYADLMRTFGREATSSAPAAEFDWETVARRYHRALESARMAIEASPAQATAVETSIWKLIDRALEPGNYDDEASVGPVAEEAITTNPDVGGGVAAGASTSASGSKASGLTDCPSPASSSPDVPADTIESVLAPYFETQVNLLPEAVDAVKRVASGSAGTCRDGRERATPSLVARPAGRRNMILLALTGGGMFINTEHAPRVDPIKWSHSQGRGTVTGGLCVLCGHVELNARHYGHRDCGALNRRSVGQEDAA